MNYILRVEMVAGCMIVYDFPSENITRFESVEQRRRVGDTRIRACRLLRGVGLNATDSLILVPKELVKKAEDRVASVKRLYRELEAEFKNNGVDIRLEPEIRLLPLDREQFNELLPMARRRVLARLQRGRGIIENYLQWLSTNIDSVDKKRVLSNVVHLLNDLRRMCEQAKMLGINAFTEYKKIEELVESGIRRQ